MINIEIVTQIPKSNAACVYRISFPDGSFYIGSTINFRQRLSQYKSSFKNSIGSVNKLISNKAKQFNVCFMDIIEVSITPKDVYTLEDKHIKSNIGNSNILNRSNNAFNNAGMVKNQVLNM